MAIVLSTPLPVGTGLDLKAIWFNAASDLADVMAFQYAGDSYDIAPTSQAEGRVLANRIRLTRTGTKSYAPISLSLERISPVQLLWLDDHKGQLMCFRDPIGTKLYGFYKLVALSVSTLPTDEHGNADLDGDLYAVAKVSFEQIDHSEAAD